MIAYVRHCLFALGLAGLSLNAAPILADPVAVDAKTVVTAPNWTPGSNWYYSDGYAIKVTSVTPEATVFDRLDAPGQWFSRQGFLRKDLTSGTATRTSVFRTVSDQAGMALHAGSPLTFQREYLENGVLMVHASSWSVEGRETVTVPAGTFDCWIIVWRSRSLRSDWTGFERWWYSPQAQNYVRMEYKYGPDAEGSRVLMRYQLGNQAAENVPSLQPNAPLPVAPAKTATVEPAPTLTYATAPAESGGAAPVPAKPALPAPASAPVLATEPAPATASQPRTPMEAKHASALPAPSPLKMKSAYAADPATVPGDRVWHAQIASSREEAAVHKSLENILRSHTETLKNVPSGISAARIGERGIFYRAWLGQFDRSADAMALCSTLRASGAACSVSKSARDEGPKLAAKL